MIFEDVTQRRWRITVSVFTGLIILMTALISVYLFALKKNVSLPLLPGTSSDIPGQLHALPESAFPTIAASSSNILVGGPLLPSSTQRMLAQVAPSPYAFSTLRQHGERGMTRSAFLVQSDRESVDSFERHADALDVVMPDWYSVTGTTCVFGQHISEDVRSILHQRRAAIIPRVANVEDGRWRGKELSSILRTPRIRSCLANSLANAVGQTDSKGINVDFEEVDPADREVLLEFFAELAHRLHTQQQILTIDIPIRNEAFDLRALSQIADGLILMAYDQHETTSGPGPIAAQSWVEEAIKRFLQVVPPEKAILAVGAYGYDWRIGNPPEAHSLTYRKIMSLARDVEATPSMDPASKNMRFAYRDALNRTHLVWFFDEQTFWNTERLASMQNMTGLALWRLGSEDEHIWRIWQPSASSTPPVGREEALPPLEQPLHDTVSEVFRVLRVAQPGSVKREIDERGFISASTYLVPPAPTVLEPLQKQLNPRQLVLTFDDGPDPIWTPQVLALLKKHHVQATFFFVGEQMQAHPDIVRQAVAEGHLIGSHTYTHTDIRNLTPDELNIELNRTQRLLTSIINRKTALFRPPYHPETTPRDLEELRPLPNVSSQGYAIVGANIDARDWATTSTDLMLASVKRQLTDPKNHIVLFHDGGGDRAATVSAVDQLLNYAKQQGYQIVGLDTLMGVARTALNLPLSIPEYFLAHSAGIAEQLRSWQWRVIYALFLFTNILSIFRIIFLAFFALRSKHDPSPVPPALRQAPVSVIIPAYNEEKTIAKTLRSLQKSTHTNFEALVMNDGSTDGTAEVVRAIQKEDPRIKLINKKNGGKFSALNLGFEKAKNDLVVTIDADTILYPQTINELIKPFGDPTVDAVCGNVEVGNVHNLLTGFQALEYITTQNFDRRAFEKLNCISVVPGATGAWRRHRVLEIGGYEADTLVEDADVTLRLLQHRGKIVYAPEARSRTEAPETIGALTKQRLRWSFGTYQCLRKHAKCFFRGTLGWIALPNIFFFQILYPVLSPLGDLVFIWALFHWQVQPIIFGYFLFIVIDLVGSVLAFSLEKRSPGLILLIFIQRFFYRQFMYVIAFRSVIAVLRGTRQGWNKLKRQGSVKYAEAPSRA